MEKDKMIKSKYIYQTSVTSDNKETIKRQCFAFGYLDGYFDEVVYEENIEICEMENKYYNLGFLEGKNDRLRQDNDILLKLEKATWVKKLALYDSMNGINGRKLSSLYKNLYEEIYQNNLIIRGEKKR